MSEYHIKLSVNGKPYKTTTNGRSAKGAAIKVLEELTQQSGITFGDSLIVSKHKITNKNQDHAVIFDVASILDELGYEFDDDDGPIFRVIEPN